MPIEKTQGNSVKITGKLGKVINDAKAPPKKPNSKGQKSK